MTTRKLTGRQVRWSEILSQYNFRLQFRAGIKAASPDALSRQSQDVPQDINDLRLKEREFQLLRDEWMKYKMNYNAMRLLPVHTSSDNKMPMGRDLFEDNELQSLGIEVLMKTKISVKFTKLYGKKIVHSLVAWNLRYQ